MKGRDHWCASTLSFLLDPYSHEILHTKQVLMSSLDYPDPSSRGNSDSPFEGSVRYSSGDTRLSGSYDLWTTSLSEVRLRGGLHQGEKRGQVS